MVVQINFQNYNDKPRRIGAAFAVDANNNPVVALVKSLVQKLSESLPNVASTR